MWVMNTWRVIKIPYFAHMSIEGNAGYLSNAGKASKQLHTTHKETISLLTVFNLVGTWPGQRKNKFHRKFKMTM